jgi:hypothetical protein
MDAIELAEWQEFFEIRNEQQEERRKAMERQMERNRRR